MRRTSILAFAVAFVLAGCQGTPPSNTAKLPALKDDVALQGTWIVASIEQGGFKQEQLSEKQRPLMIIGDGSMKLKDNADAAERVASFKVDASQNPKHIDITIPRTTPSRPALGTEPGAPGEQTETWKCVYELDGDTLKICMPPSNGDRPKEVSGAANNILYTYKRK